MFKKLVRSALSLTLLAVMVAGVALPSASAQDGSQIVMAIYGELQEIVLEDSPLVFLAWRDQSYAAVKDLQGFANLPGFLSFQSGISLEEAYLE